MPRILWNLINAVQAVYTVTWSAFWITAALVVRGIANDNKVSLAMARRIWAPGLLRGGSMKVEVRGLENVDFTRPHFFASNHQSIVDIPALFYVLPVPLLFILKEELRKVPFLGWYVSAMGMILLPRQERRRSLANLGQCRERIAEGKSVVTFPEGTRSRDGRIGPFKSGTFVPAIDAQVPIVPIAMDGPGQILPPGGFRVRPGTIRVAIGRPVPTEGLEPKDRRALAQTVRQQMLELWREIRS